MGGKGCFWYPLCIYFSHRVSYPAAKHLFLTHHFISRNQHERIALLRLEKEGEEVFREESRDGRIESGMGL